MSYAVRNDGNGFRSVNNSSDCSDNEYFSEKIPEFNCLRHIPNSVTRFKAIAALHQSGILDDVELAIQGADFMTQLAWKEAQSFERDSSMISAIGASVGLTDYQIDNLFISASKIK